MSNLILGGFSGNLILQGYDVAIAVVDPTLPTLIVEDGSARPDAESFASVAYADDYFLRRKIGAWAALVLSDKEAALRQASDYIEQYYRFKFAGYRYTQAQSLSWPRWEVYSLDTAYGYYGWSNFVGFNTVPDLVKKATVELALRASTGIPLLKDTGRLKQRVRIGGLQGVDITYAPSSYNQNLIYTTVEGYLRPFLQSFSPTGEAHAIRIERA